MQLTGRETAQKVVYEQVFARDAQELKPFEQAVFGHFLYTVITIVDTYNFETHAACEAVIALEPVYSEWLKLMPAAQDRSYLQRYITELYTLLAKAHWELPAARTPEMQPQSETVLDTFIHYIADREYQHAETSTADVLEGYGKLVWLLIRIAVEISGDPEKDVASIMSDIQQTLQFKGYKDFVEKAHVVRAAEAAETDDDDADLVSASSIITTELDDARVLGYIEKIQDFYREYGVVEREYDGYEA